MRTVRRTQLAHRIISKFVTAVVCQGDLVATGVFGLSHSNYSEERPTGAPERGPVVPMQQCTASELHSGYKFLSQE
jgi:hypothetical protein